MIDEKKIQAAADECALKAFEEQALLAEISFKEGVHWFLDNLWHGAKQIPVEGKFILMEAVSKYSDSAIYYDTCRFYGDETQWLFKVKFEKITRWCFIEDLMKGGEK